MSGWLTYLELGGVLLGREIEGDAVLEREGEGGHAGQHLRGDVHGVAGEDGTLTVDQRREGAERAADLGAGRGVREEG